MLSEVGVVTIQQRLSNIAGQEGQSVAVTTFTDIRTETNKVNDSYYDIKHRHIVRTGGCYETA